MGDNRQRFSLLLVAVAAALIVAARLTVCAPTVVMGQTFTFPPGADPMAPADRGGWQYAGEVAVSWSRGGFAEKSDKRVRIHVQDANDRRVLDDSLGLGSVASVEATAVWQQAERLRIELREVGYRDAAREGDQYNQALLKSGPRLLTSIEYRYDRASKTFKRISKTP